MMSELIREKCRLEMAGFMLDKIDIIYLFFRISIITGNMEVFCLDA